MRKKLKLTTIILETSGGQVVELNMDEAKDLHSQLNELFGMKFMPTPSPFWYGDTEEHDYPKGPQCIVQGDSGLNATYCVDVQ